MKTLILLVSITFSTISMADEYKACLCNFNNCWDQKKASCTQVVRCDKVTEDKFYSLLSDRRILDLRLNAKTICINPYAGYMRN